MDSTYDTNGSCDMKYREAHRMGSDNRLSENPAKDAFKG
jgi:hypothetical protein